jgi:hypothetical protein
VPVKIVASMHRLYHRSPREHLKTTARGLDLLMFRTIPHNVGDIIMCFDQEYCTGGGSGTGGAPTLDGTPCLCFPHNWSWQLFICLHRMFVRGMRVADRRRLEHAVTVNDLISALPNLKICRFLFPLGALRTRSESP